MNIFKTFEIFLSEPISLFKNKLIQIANINTGITSEKPSINVDMMEKKAQITVVNSDKMYNLLSTVMYKRKIQAAQDLRKHLPQTQQKQLPQKPTRMVIGQLMKRA